MMFNKKYKKGMADAAKAYQEFGHKQEDALNHILEEVHHGKLDLEEVLKKIGGNIDNLYDHLKSKEKAQLYTVYTPFDIKQLGEQEKFFLAGALLELTTVMTPNDNQQNYVRAILKYLDIKEAPFGTDLLAIENIEDIPTQKAIYQAILEFLRLQDGEYYDENEKQQSFLDAFSLSEKARHEIADRVELLYAATGAKGLAEKYGYVPEEEPDEAVDSTDENLTLGDRGFCPNKITGDVVDRICYVHGWSPYDLNVTWKTSYIETADFIFCNPFEGDGGGFGGLFNVDEDGCIFNKQTGEEKRIKFESFSLFIRNYAVEPVGNVIYYENDGYLFAFDLSTLEKPQKLFKIPGDRPKDVLFSANNGHIAFRGGDAKLYVYDIETNALTKIPEQKGGGSIYAVADGAYYGTNDYQDYELKFYDYKTKKTSVICALKSSADRILHVEDGTRFYIAGGSYPSYCCGIVDISHSDHQEKLEIPDTFDVMDITYDNSNNHIHVYHDGIAFVDNDEQIVFVRYKDDAVIKLAPDAAVHEYYPGGLFRKASSSTTPVDFFRIADWICYTPKGDNAQFNRVSLDEPGNVEVIREYDNDYLSLFKDWVDKHRGEDVDTTPDFRNETELRKQRNQIPEIVL